MPLSPPVATYSDDFYVFEWRKEGVEFQLERFTERKEDIACELTVNLDHSLAGGRLYSGRLLIIGPNSRRDVRKELEERFTEADWGAMLEQACQLSRERFRRGAPAVSLSEVDFSNTAKHLMSPFLLERAITIIYGDGATAKSTFLLAWCVALALGEPVMGLTPSRLAKCLYLDWEDDAETHAERLAAICAGIGISRDQVKDQILYQRRSTRISESVRETRRLIAENHVDFVAVDSLGMAAGDPNNHDYMIEAVRACRALDVSVGAIHHLPKDQKDKTKPFGSVYASNEARSTWLFEKSQEEASDELSVLLTHQKTNRSQKYGKRAYTVAFQNNEDALERIEFHEKDVGQIEAFRGKLPQQQLIKDALLANRELTVAGIQDVLAADGISINANTIGAVLRRFEGKLFVKREAGKWAALYQEVKHV